MDTFTFTNYTYVLYCIRSYKLCYLRIIKYYNLRIEKRQSSVCILLKNVPDTPTIIQLVLKISHNSNFRNLLKYNYIII